MKLVYLHIPKSGGTSQRLVFYDVYGEENVFWHGINNIPGDSEYNAEQLVPFTVLGGHKPITFYPQDMDAFYLSVVREPISRAVSLYSYYTKPHFAEEHYVAAREREFEVWQERGMDSDSLLNSLDRCPEFRREIENYQCRYLSRHENTFDGVLDTLADMKGIICELQFVDAMNSRLSQLMQWQRIPARQTNRSRENTHEFILRERGVKEALAELMTEDLRLYQHIVEDHHGLYVDLPMNAQSYGHLRPTVPVSSISKAQFPWSLVQLYSKGFIGIRDDGHGSVGVVIINHSSMHIDSHRFPELTISYSIHDQQGEQLGDGATFAQPMQLPVSAQGKLTLSLEVEVAEPFLADADSIRIWLSISPEETVLDHNPLHIASAQIFRT